MKLDSAGALMPLRGFSRWRPSEARLPVGQTAWKSHDGLLVVSSREDAYLPGSGFVEFDELAGPVRRSPPLVGPQWLVSVSRYGRGRDRPDDGQVARVVDAFAMPAFDKVCQGCGSDGRTIGDAWYRVLRAICPRPTPPRLLDFCRANDWYPDHVEARDAYRAHVRRQQAPWVHARELLDEHRRRHRLEVNHKTPCLGAHRENSCAHHLGGLEVLCHPCHLRVTARQRAAGLLHA